MPPSPERTLDRLSVVAPVYDERDLIDAFCQRVAATLDGLPYELVLVDDGSSDGSAERLDEIAAADQRVKVVHLSRNFGHQTALSAGLDHATGNVVVMIDSDLQDPPEVILDMVERWRAGSDVVYGVRRARAGETRFKLLTAGWFYRLFSRLAQIELTPDSGDFRLMDRRALDVLLAMRERNRFLRGMTVWVGFTQSAVEYERVERGSGESKYTLRRMVRLSFDALAAFSTTPLQLATLIGFASAGLAFLAIPVVVVARISHIFVPGISTTLVAVLLLGGIQLITIGIVGEYIGRIYDEVKRRPLYVVRERRNMDDRTAVDQTERERISRW